MSAGKGSPEAHIPEAEIAPVLAAGMPERLFAGKRVLVLTPDATRTCPLPAAVRAVREVIGTHCARLDFMVALGTHTPLAPERILKLYGIERPADFPNSSFFNHDWDRPDAFRRLTVLSADEVERISEGLLREEVPVDINRRIFDYDLLLVVGPVFPHEVVGFSGGAKYLFPGISGGDFLHFFHWLGAVLTCKRIIGVKQTPVRRLIERATESVPVPIRCLSMVVRPDASLCGLFAGEVREAWSQAADLSARIHVVTKPRAFHTVLGRASEMYDEIWTAGKVMYKLEQVVAPGGRLIIYAPHVREVSRTWGALIEKAGYHTRDYFLAQMDRFRDIPRGVLAHATHVRGTGTYADGVERPDVEVILATAIPEASCRRINLGYMDPASVRLDDYRNREADGILFVDHAGEILYRLAE